MANRAPHEDDHDHENEDDAAMLDPDEAEEILEQGDDAAMDSGEEDDDGVVQEIQLQNDSVAHFELHKDSIFCIAQHPTRPQLIVTGGGDDMAYLWDATPEDNRPVLPRSYQSNPSDTPQERKGLEALGKLDGHDESVNSVCFTLPAGEFIVTGSLAGRVGVYATPKPNAVGSAATSLKVVGEVKEVEEVNWLAPCPHAGYPNAFAFGGSDGAVWVYNVTPEDPNSPVTLIQSFFLHRAPSTAGAWTPDGKLLATVAEDSTLHVWDVFGEAAAVGLADPNGGQAIVSLTGEDERFRVEGGLYSVAISPGGGIVAVGGAGGQIRVVGLPRLGAAANTNAAGPKGRGKTAGGKPVTTASAGQSGQILASLQAQGDGVETLDFSQPPLTLLAAGSVDGSIALFDAAHNFAVRRHIPEAHEEEAVIQVAFVKTPLGTSNEKNYVLTSCGNDGVVRRWDVRGGTAAANKGLMTEWRGHRGGGEGGGILGFVQGGGGNAVVTAGDDGVALVFAES